MLGLIAMASCSKSTNSIGLTNNGAALTIVNMIHGSHGFYTNFTSESTAKGGEDTLKWYSSAAKIAYGGSMEFSSYTGSQPVAIASETDTSVEEWSGTLNLSVGSIYSLYFTGLDTMHIDTLLTQDSPPNYAMGDSSVGIRFIHLAQQTDPVTVDIMGRADTLVSTIGYKGVTDFFTLSATSNDAGSTGYTFEFRDAMTGVVLSTYAYRKLNYFKSITVVLGGNGSISSWSTYVVKDY